MYAFTGKFHLGCIRIAMKPLFVLAFLATLGGGTAQAETNQVRNVATFNPNRHSCLSILEFARLQIDQRTGFIQLNLLSSGDLNLAGDYQAFIGWLMGYVTARNAYDPNISPTTGAGTRPIEWMNWVYSYCRSHPSDEAIAVAYELSSTLAGHPH
jgi:hypothetical protein